VAETKQTAHTEKLKNRLEDASETNQEEAKKRSERRMRRVHTEKKRRRKRTIVNKILTEGGK